MNKFIKFDAVKLTTEKDCGEYFLNVSICKNIIINIDYIISIEPYNILTYVDAYYKIYILAGKSVDAYTITAEVYNKIVQTLKNSIIDININNKDKDY